MTGAMTEPSPCVLCGLDLADAPVVGTRDRDGREICRVECVECHLVQAHPRPSAAEISEHYRGTYWTTHPLPTLQVLGPGGGVWSVSPDDTAAYEAALDAGARSRMAALGEQLQLPSGARVLEVGCSDGRMLAAMMRAGLEAYGIEPDDTKAAVARERTGSPWVMGGDLIADADRLLDAVGLVDAVISFHVLEHLHDPLGALITMRRFLRRGGLVWLEVPDLSTAREPLDQHWWQWVHVCDFTETTLRALMERAGLTDIVIRRAFSGLQAVGRHDPEVAPRPYSAPERDPSSSAAGEASALDRLLVGDLDALSTEQAHEVRVEMKRWVESVGRLHDVWRSSSDTLAQLGLVLEAQGMSRMAMHHEDPWHHGFMIGEAFALLRTSKLLALMSSAMRMREHRDEQHEVQT